MLDDILEPVWVLKCSRSLATWWINEAALSVVIGKGHRTYRQDKELTEKEQAVIEATNVAKQIPKVVADTRFDLEVAIHS